MHTIPRGYLKRAYMIGWNGKYPSMKSSHWKESISGIYKEEYQKRFSNHKRQTVSGNPG